MNTFQRFYLSKYFSSSKIGPPYTTDATKERRGITEARGHLFIFRIFLKAEFVYF
jgi:hypothetical protein